MVEAQVVLITGGSSGLGEATARYLSRLGYRVYGTTRNPDRYPEPRDFPLLAMDVTAKASVDAAITELISREGRIDILVNNAGVGITGPLEETPHAQSLHAMETNFHGPLRVMEAVLPHMRKQGSGRIVNITSIAGWMGLPYRGMYSASKAALEIASEAIRMEVRSMGVKVSTLAPGDYATNIASGRYHSPLREDSPYATEYGRSLELMNAHVSEGSDPLEVAKKLHKILKAGNPKVHYAVGSPMQKFSLVLKRLLPATWYERLLRNHYKL